MTAIVNEIGWGTREQALKSLVGVRDSLGLQVKPDRAGDGPGVWRDILTGNALFQAPPNGKALPGCGDESRP